MSWHEAVVCDHPDDPEEAAALFWTSQGACGQSESKEGHAQLVHAILFFCVTGYLHISALSSRCYTTLFVVLALLAPHPFCTSCGDGDADCGWQSLNKKPVFSGQPEFICPPFYPAPSTLPSLVSYRSLYCMDRGLSTSYCSLI